MNADYVENIIRNIDKQSYRCILVDGAWGIGKSYMVKKALEDMKDRTCFISLFGIESAQRIYHEVLYQLLLHTQNGGKFVEWLKDATKVLGIFNEQAKGVNAVLESRFSEQDMLKVVSQKLEMCHIIVLDDLERRKNELNLEELFGIIEELKQLNYIKIIIIANSKEIDEFERKIFDKYKEKVVDRVFEITEHSADIKWLDFGIDGEFAENFLSRHNVKNLRTLQKAQNFYDEVEQYCVGIDDRKFLNEIKMICYSIVIEDIDRIYYNGREVNEKQNSSSNIWRKLENEFSTRLKKYLRGIKCSDILVNSILEYYTNQSLLTTTEIQREYQAYIESDGVSNYYKSEKSIRAYLRNWQKRIECAKQSNELTIIAGDIDGWFEILGEDDKELTVLYKERLKKMLIEESCNNISLDENPLDVYNVNGLYNVTTQIKTIYRSVLDEVKHIAVKKYAEYLCKNADDNLAYRYSYWLRKWYTEHSDLKKVIDLETDILFTENAFPTGDITDRRYSTCYNVITILYLYNRENFKIHYDKMKKRFDKMTIHRVNCILREIEEEYPEKTD